MPGIILPHDRSIKQEARGFCLNPACRGETARFEFPVHNDRFACPKCGANEPPLVGLLVLTHLLIDDPQGAMIGVYGKRYRLACDAKRAYLATLTNQEAATGILSLVDCAGCLAEAARRKLNTVQGFALNQ